MVFRLSKESKEFLKKLDILAEKIDILTTVTAVSVQQEKLFKGKTQKEQIKLLAKMGLNRNVIALMVGTTPLTVSVTLSQMRKKKKAKPKREPEQRRGQKVEQK